MLTAAVLNSKLAALDYLVIALFLIGTLVIGLVMSKRARKDTASYFKGAGTLPWWLLGTSMVATTFAADTPLALAGWVVGDGVSKNWFWWAQVPFVIGGVFFFAHLWRRANPMTDMEFLDQRYSGKSAKVLRGFKAGYLSLVYNTIVMGWVNLAMGKILAYIFPELPRLAVLDKIFYAIIMATPISSGVAEESHQYINSSDGSSHFVVVYDSLRSELADAAVAANHEVNFDTSEDVLRWRKKDIEIWTSVVNARGINLAAPEIGENQFAAEVMDESYTSLTFANDLKFINSSLNQFKILAALFILVLVYTAISGLWGVVVTDFLQFWIAMFGCIYLAYAAVHHLGGMENTLARMAELYPGRAQHMVSILPDFSVPRRLGEFLLLILVSWWASGFTDGGSFFAQRLLSAKNGYHAALGYLWFAIANYGLRMWPWLLVGFAAAVMFPYTAGTGMDAEAGYIKVMLVVLGPGMLGLMVASFFSAYMSTISTHLNLGASYVVNDLYRPFIVRNRDEKHYIRASIVTTLICAALGMIISLFMTSIGKAWYLLAAFTAGIGIIHILRWYWWRINAWTEIVCISSLIIITAVVKLLPMIIPMSEEALATYNLFAEYPFSLLYSLPLSFALSIAATYLTPPVDMDKLKDFHRRVQAGGPGWRRIDREVRLSDPSFKAASPLHSVNFLNWLLGTLATYSYLWGIGLLVVGRVPGVAYSIPPRALGVFLIVVGSLLLVWLVRMLRRQPIVESE